MKVSASFLNFESNCSTWILTSRIPNWLYFHPGKQSVSSTHSPGKSKSVTSVRRNMRCRIWHCGVKADCRIRSWMQKQQLQQQNIAQYLRKTPQCQLPPPQAKTKTDLKSRSRKEKTLNSQSSQTWLYTHKCFCQMFHWHSKEGMQRVNPNINDGLYT